MIVDVGRFAASEKRYWDELAALLDRMANDAAYQMDVEGARRLHYLYQRAASDLARLSDFPRDHSLRLYLEPLVARAYAEIHEIRADARRFNIFEWFLKTFPQTFRAQFWAFRLSLGITIAGVLFGAMAVYLDSSAKGVLLPFAHLQGDPRERVKEEEEQALDRQGGVHTQFAAMLMTHNTQVSIMTLAFGVTFGIGTVVLLFYNGVILGAVAVDYIRAGEGLFLTGWLLPHGSIEIPSILIAGQAGLILGRTLIGWGDNRRVRSRLRRISPTLATLICAVGIMLIWAGIVESFFSQTHEPVLPYWVKITVGCVELIALTWFLFRAGRSGADGKAS